MPSRVLYEPDQARDSWFLSHFYPKLFFKGTKSPRIPGYNYVGQRNNTSKNFKSRKENGALDHESGIIMKP